MWFLLFASFHVDHNLDEQISPGSQNRSDFAPQKVDQKTIAQTQNGGCLEDDDFSFWGAWEGLFSGAFAAKPLGGYINFRSTPPASVLMCWRSILLLKDGFWRSKKLCLKDFCSNLWVVNLSKLLQKKNIFTSWLQQFHDLEYEKQFRNELGSWAIVTLVMPRIGRFYERKSLGETGKWHLAPWKEIHVFFSFQFSLL